ncbi:MAG: hypothetical protein C5B59_12510 [Bacteroidetes bacterium]|nr:MAG: hypothetical protein C5B59_12510 [Bacteroidota bacterium]
MLLKNTGSVDIDSKNQSYPLSFEFFINLCKLKKMATILLLGILLFNCYGYQLLVTYLGLRANQRLENLVDRNDFKESDLISIKVPAKHLGYFLNSSQFERVTGRIDIAGVQYNYVKRRVFNDNLELFCIPNLRATELNYVRNKMTNWTYNLLRQSKKSESNTSIRKNLLNEFYTTTETQS